MTKRRVLVVIASIVFMASLSVTDAQQAPSQGAPGPGSQPSFPPMERLSPGVYRLGEIQIHKKARTITFPAHVNMSKGLIEYFLVKSTGKTHESVLRTDVEPYILNIAFLLLGFEGTDRPLAEQGGPGTPRGEAVEITVVYHDGKENRKIPAEMWMVQEVEKKLVVPKMNWVYTGSMVMQGRFVAQEQGSIVAVYHDPTALIDHTSEGGVSDEIWFVREGAVPAPGTQVTVIVRKLAGDE